MHQLLYVIIASVKKYLELANLKSCRSGPKSAKSKGGPAPLIKLYMSKILVS
jgi:hypothetical protein